MELGSIHISSSVEGNLAYALWQPKGEWKGTVICVHGLSRQKRDFDFLAEFLSAQGYRVYAVDVPGRGGSMHFKDPDLYRLDIYADVFSDFIKKMDIWAVHWIGTSMGGLIAMEMADNGFAGVFQSLTLIDVTSRPHPVACRRISSYFSQDMPVFPSIESYVDFLKISLPLGDVPENVWRHYAEHQLVKINRGYALHFDPKIAIRAQADMQHVIDLKEGLKKITCPISLVAGGLSDLCTEVEIEEFKALKPQARVHMCPKAGHVPALSDKATQEFILQGLV